VISKEKKKREAERIEVTPPRAHLQANTPNFLTTNDKNNNRRRLGKKEKK
jgi:hypothetical protein